MKRFLSYAAILLPVLAPAVAPAQAIRPADAAGYIRFVEGLMGLSFNPQQEQEIRGFIAAYETSRDQKARRVVEQSAAHQRMLAAEPAGMRDAVYRMLRADALIGLHAAAEKGEADSQWILNRYYAVNPALAPAKPGGLPLTRDMVEASLAIEHWKAAEIHKQNAPYPDPSVIQQAVRLAAHDHARLTGAQQVALARQPGEWARIRNGWANASPMDRLLARKDMGARLTPQEEALIQQMLAGLQAQLGALQQQQTQMLNSAIQNMKQNSEIIMGRGTVWNPATSRWEQQGGILTEYDGRVTRVP